MAKWGEGDPRWIVEERPDATNVNNWHWTEKNACQWSKDKLKELLVNLSLKNSCGTCKITEVEKCEGDASANNRKAKIIIFFEWELRLKWVGKSKSGESVSGTIEIPNVSDENGVEDLDIQFLTEEKSSEAVEMKSALRAETTTILKAQLENYVQLLKEEFTQGMILPKRETSNPCVNSNMSNLKLSETATNGGVKLQLSEDKSENVKLHLSDLETSTTMKCTAADVYNSLTRPEMFVAFTHGGRIDPSVGGKFEMFGGNVHGTIIELKEPTKIVQQWRFKTWPEGHFSKVVFTIEQRDDTTQITVKQTGIPYSDMEKTREGWEKYYWEAMKRTFGFGSMIL